MAAYSLFHSSDNDLAVLAIAMGSERSVAFLVLKGQLPTVTEDNLKISNADLVDMLYGSSTLPVTKTGQEGEGSIFYDFDHTVITIGNARVEIKTPDFVDSIRHLLHRS